MSEQIYEHHLTIKQNKLCPFLFKSSNGLHDSVCNWHTNIEILLVTDGEGYVQYNSDELPLEKHDIIIINSGDLHRVCSEKGISFDYMIIDESFCRENGINTKDRSFERIVRSERTEELCRGAYQCYKDYQTDSSPMKAARLRLSVLELLIRLYSKHSSSVFSEDALHRSPRDYVKGALEYLAEHYTEALTLEDVASVCGITKYHLAREFKRFTGQTVITYINILRCKKAEVCLAGGMTVTEVAGECGFDSISYFSRTYKKLMGYSPSSKKQKIKE